MENKHSIFRLGLSTFGEKEKFRRWLCKNNLSFSAKPIDLLKTKEGIKQVINALNRIEHGNFS